MSASNWGNQINSVQLEIIIFIIGTTIIQQLTAKTTKGYYYKNMLLMKRSTCLFVVWCVFFYSRSFKFDFERTCKCKGSFILYYSFNTQMLSSISGQVKKMESNNLIYEINKFEMLKFFFYDQADFNEM